MRRNLIDLDMTYYRSKQIMSIAADIAYELSIFGDIETIVVEGPQVVEESAGIVKSLINTGDMFIERGENATKK